MTHFDWILNNFFIYEVDMASKSVLFVADGEVVCEINGTPYPCEDRNEFWELVEFFDGETFEV